MAIEFSCPECGAILRVPDNSVGKKAKCPKCETISEVKASGAEPQAPAGNDLFGGSGGLSEKPDDGFPGIDTSSPSDRSQPTSPNPFSDSSASPFGTAKPGADENPYATPQGMQSGPTAWSGGEAGHLRHCIIDFGQVFGAAWSICTENLGPCLLVGLVMIGVAIGMQIVGQIAQVVAAVTGSMALVLVAQGAVFVFNIVVQTAIQLGLWNFGIQLCRDGRADVGQLFTFGRFLVRGILVTLLIWLITAGIVIVCGTPIGIAIFAMGGDRAFEDAPHIILPLMIVFGGAGIAALIWVTFRIYLVMPFIVDRDLGVIDALKMSDTFMAGNKLTTFLIMLVTGAVSLAITLVTCCIGLLFVYPYMAVMMSMIYVAATGQMRDARLK